MTTRQSDFPRVLLYGFGILGLTWFLWTIRNILLLGLAALILVVFITIPVNLLARLRIGRFPAIVLTFIGTAIFIYVLMLLVIPTLFDQFTTLLNETIPAGVEAIGDFIASGELQETFPFLEDININLDEIQLDLALIQEVLERSSQAFRQVSGSVLPFITGVANTVLSMLIVFFLTIFFLSDPDTYKNGFVKLFPLWYRDRVRYILERLNFLLRRWIYATLIGIFITGMGTFIGLSMVGIREAAALAVLTALFSFVPNFGELLATLIAVAVAAVQAPDSVPLVIVVIYGVSFVQGQIFAPLITFETVNIPPVLILLGQIVVAGFFGVLGIILAVPIIAIAMTLVQEVYIKDILGDYGDETQKVTQAVPSVRSERIVMEDTSEAHDPKLLSDNVG
ncbi:MAG: AI-2E family transporter [Anaerolineae bacterium]